MVLSPSSWRLFFVPVREKELLMYASFELISNSTQRNMRKIIGIIGSPTKNGFGSVDWIGVCTHVVEMPNQRFITIQ